MAKDRAWLLLCLCLLSGVTALAQDPVRPTGLDSRGRPTGPASRMQGGDSLKRRDDLADSITIFYRMIDSSRTMGIDSGVSDFYKRFPLPFDHLNIGGLGGASRSLIFSPNVKPGFDAGFHAFDAFRFQLQDTRLFSTTRPYTEFDYILGSRSEQTIKILHTQNITPAWNASFEYRFVNQPGHFKNNNTSHGNIRFGSNFATRNKRYSGVAVFISNNNRSSENGGIVSDTFLNSTNAAYNDRFNIPVWLGGDGNYSSNFFSTAVNTGNIYKQQHIYLQHQFDFGQKDSVLRKEDSSYARFFYPRLRIQHTFNFRNEKYGYIDNAITAPGVDTIYPSRYGFTPVDVPFSLQDGWRDISNEAALFFFPEKDNQNQYLKLGAGLQLLQGTLGKALLNFSNTYLLGEYRFRTRNRKWDINVDGRLYTTGEYAGNYTAGGYVATSLGKNAGILQLRFRNTNRTPSFVFDDRSAFIAATPGGFNAENWTRAGGTYINPKIGLTLTGDYYIVSNYTYWKDYIVPAQESSLISVLQVSAEKKFRLAKHWNWYAQLVVQPETADAINLPLLYMRNRIAYEGLFFKNLNLSTGVEFRYYSPFTADDWAPFNGQWVVQNNTTISNRPDIAGFLHLRIKSFRLFTRLENLNTVSFDRGFGFLNNNLSAPLYPTPGMVFRLGIYWSFVN